VAMDSASKNFVLFRLSDRIFFTSVVFQTWRAPYKMTVFPRNKDSMRGFSIILGIIVVVLYIKRLV
jgi:hypothetical protein